MDYMTSSFIPVVSWSNDALPDDGSTACCSHHFFLQIWSLTLDLYWPTGPLCRWFRWPWSFPGCENLVGASSMSPGCGWSLSLALLPQQPGISLTCRLTLIRAWAHTPGVPNAHLFCDVGIKYLLPVLTGLWHGLDLYQGKNPQPKTPNIPQAERFIIWWVD